MLTVCGQRFHLDTVNVWFTVLTPAALRACVAVVTHFAVLAVVAVRVVQTPEAGTGPGVAGAGVLHVDVVVTLTGCASPTNHQGVTEVTGRTFITSDTWKKRKI